MNFFENIGRNILSLLEEQNKSQTFLADQIGVSRQVMLKITKGKKAINALEISKLATALGVNIEKITNQNELITEEQRLVMFMGEIRNNQVKEKFEFLNYIIDEIVHLEDDLSEQVQQ
jgi:transcriptional regulator with XRE-family HTH domain